MVLGVAKMIACWLRYRSNIGLSDRRPSGSSSPVQNDARRDCQGGRARNGRHCQGVDKHLEYGSVIDEVKERPAF